MMRWTLALWRIEGPVLSAAWPDHKMVRWLLTILCLVILPVCSRAQQIDFVQTEKILVDFYESKLSGPDHRVANDSIAIYDSIFRQRLTNLLAEHPRTLTYGFPLFTKSYGLTVAGSDDHRFRIYSWDQRSGGSMHTFGHIYQFASAGQVYVWPAKDEFRDPGVSYGKVATVTSAGNTYYLAIGQGIYSSAITGQRFKVFAIENGSLNDTVRLIQTKDGHLENQIDVHINLFLHYPGSDTADTYGEVIQFMEYDPKEMTLAVPIVDHRKDSVTTESTIYQFDGKYFTYITTRNNKDEAKVKLPLH